MDRTAFMRRAIELSCTAVDRPGTQPYGAVIVKDGEIVGEGLNHAEAHFDPTSHGEVEAIRDACRKLKTTDLSGCELYTSCEPCILCVATMYWARIGKLYYAVSLEQGAGFFGSAVAGRNKVVKTIIDNDELGRQVVKPAVERDMPAEQMLADEGYKALADWWAKMRASN
jgi:guanine deaminase